MKVLVVYDTVSPSRATEKVAQMVAETLRERGLEVDSLYIEDVDKSTVKDYDCLIAGAPTMAFSASKGIMRFLDGLLGEGLKGKRAAAFDTQMQMLMSGNATKGIEKKLKNLGLSLFASPLVIYVESKDKTAWEFKTGQLEKAKKWAEEAAKALSG